MSVAQTYGRRVTVQVLYWGALIKVKRLKRVIINFKPTLGIYKSGTMLTATCTYLEGTWPRRSIRLADLWISLKDVYIVQVRSGWRWWVWFDNWVHYIVAESAVPTWTGVSPIGLFLGRNINYLRPTEVHLPFDIFPNGRLYQTEGGGGGGGGEREKEERGKSVSTGGTMAPLQYLGLIVNFFQKYFQLWRKFGQNSLIDNSTDQLDFHNTPLCECVRETVRVCVRESERLCTYKPRPLTNNFKEIYTSMY